MPNMTGLYNFNELCLEARASAPWVKKVQRLLNLGEGEGSKGARTYYTAQQVHIYSAVKKLRMMDIEFEEIKNIYEIECKLKKISQYPSPENDVKEKKNDILLHLIILLPPDWVLGFNHLDQDRREVLEKTYNEYNDMQIYLQTKTNEVQNVADKLFKDLQKIRDQNNQITQDLVK